MTPKEFNTLTQENKSDIVWEWGFLISKAKVNNKTFVLFSVNNFYVEQCIYPNGSEVIFAFTKKEFKSHELSKLYMVDPVKLNMIDKYAIIAIN